MNNNIVPINQAQRSQAMQERMRSGTSLNRNFADNVADSFPRLSIKGKVFRIRIDGKETPLIDQQTRQPIPYLDVVLVNASAYLAKAFYERGFEEGDFNPPDCWSLDSVRPDPSVANKQSPTCAMCPNNAFGSRVTPSGKQGKACADSRRIAVVMPGHLEQENPFVFMLKVPQASLKNLKAYAQLLDRQGFDTPGCVTRLSFDYNEAFPKLEFLFVDGLNDVEYAKAMALADSDTVSAMLRAPDFDAEVSTTQKAEPTSGRSARQAAPLMGDEKADDTPPPGRRQPIAEGGAAVASAEAEKRRQEAMAEAAFSQPTKASSPIPAMKEVPSELIELPDGKLFNPATGQYVERPAPKMEMPELDPDTIALPEGRFFNKKSGKYVVSGNVGAAEYKPEELPKRRARKAKAVDDGAGGVPSEAQAAPPATMEAPNDDEEQANHSANGHANGVDETVDTREVRPAPKGLDDLLASALPVRK